MGVIKDSSLTKESLSEVLVSSNTLKEAVLKLWPLNNCTYRSRLHRASLRLGLVEELNSLKIRDDLARGNSFTAKDLFVKEGPSNPVTIKKFGLRNGYLLNECYLCGQKDEWFDKKLVLQLDHIDGNNKNNELSNLRILCPNCHSQTDTYARTSKKSKKVKCTKCEKLTFNSHCKKCYKASFGIEILRKLSKEDMADLLENFSIGEIVKAFTASYTKVNKLITDLGLKNKPLGFWCEKRKHEKADLKKLDSFVASLGGVEHSAPKWRRSKD